jgi:hypothetical protein
MRLVSSPLSVTRRPCAIGFYEFLFQMPRLRALLISVALCI